MSQIETDASDILSSAIRYPLIPRSFNRTHQIALANWIFLRALTLDAGKEKDNSTFLDRPCFTSFRNSVTRTPPANSVYTWLGLLPPASRLRIEARVRDSLASRGRGGFQVGNILIGQIVFQILIVRDLGKVSFDFSEIVKPWRRNVIRLWPSPKRSVEWPPRPLEDLGAFMFRFGL